jgi:hypothetical protein
VSIDDQRDLYERLDGAVEAIAPRPAPVDGVMRRGRVIRWRRRAVAVAGVAVVAAGVVAVPSLRHAGSEKPATSRYTVTVQPPGPDSPPGLIASGTVNGQHWTLTAGRPGAGGAGRGQQFTVAAGPVFGPDSVSSSAPAFAPPATDPVSLLGLIGGQSQAQAQYGTVAAGVSYVTVRLGNGIVLTLHPARVYGVRLVGFAIPLGAPVVSATAYSARGAIATAIPFSSGGISSFVTWLRPGQSGLARASVRVGSGTYLGKAWSARAYLGPWGACLVGQAGKGEASSCEEVTSVSRLGTGMWLWTGGVPAVAVGSAAPSVARIEVTSPDGKTTQVRPVAAGGARFFAFPFGQGPKHWKWTAYDGSGHAISSGEVAPDS